MPLHDSTKLEEFFTKIKSESGFAVDAAHKEAVIRFCTAANIPMEEAVRFVAGLTTLSSKSSIVFNVSVDDAIGFLQTDKPTQTMFLTDERVARAFDYQGPAPLLAEVFRDPESPCYPGRARIVVLAPERTVVANGSLSRIVDPEHPHFTADTETFLSTIEGLGKVAACATIRDMKVANIMAGPSRMLLDFMEQKKGACDILIMDDISLASVKSVIVGSEADAQKVRGALMCRGAAVPVVMVESPSSPWPERLVDESDVTTIKAAAGAYFQTGEWIVTKPLPSLPRKKGKIVEMANGRVAVEWDDSTRSLHDLMEALCTFMPCPDSAGIKENPVYYDLKGLDDDSAMLLASLGVDPVTLYSLASYGRPANANAKGWRANFLKVMEEYGMTGALVSGQLKTSENFKKRSWFEFPLQRGLRLVIDIDHDRISVAAGLCSHYMSPLPTFGFRRE